jgi:hypothetical protein
LTTAIQQTAIKTIAMAAMATGEYFRFADFFMLSGTANVVANVFGVLGSAQGK